MTKRDLKQIVNINGTKSGRHCFVRVLSVRCCGKCFVRGQTPRAKLTLTQQVYCYDAYCLAYAQIWAATLIHVYGDYSLTDSFIFSDDVSVVTLDVSLFRLQ